jgi:MFS family permease
VRSRPELETEPVPAGTLWRHRNFLLLWSGQTVSEMGSAVTQLALPLTAVVVLRASTLQVGLLTSAATAAFALIALPAGALVDRWAKRRLMIWCDMARMLIIGSVPLAAAFGVLTLGQLYAVAITAGVCTVFFDVAYQSYLPVVVAREHLVDGNGKLGATQSFAQVVGPGLGGGLVGLVGAAGAMAADAISYAVSVVSLLAISIREEAPPADGDRAGLRAEIAEGLSFVLRHPILRKIVACTGTANLFASMALALQIVFLVRVLRVRPADTGCSSPPPASAGWSAECCLAGWPAASARRASSGTRCSCSASPSCSSRSPSPAGESPPSESAWRSAGSAPWSTTWRRSATGRPSARPGCSAG